MSSRDLRVLGCLAAFVVALAGSQAKALTFTGDCSVNVWSSAEGTLSELSPISPTETADGFTLNGDISFSLPEGVAEGQVSIAAFRNFSIGLLPEEVTYDLLQDFKVAIGGGNFLDPDATVTVTSYIQRAGSFYPDTFESSTYSHEGNGFTVVNDMHTILPFVLAPADDYALVLQLAVDLTNQPESGLPGELILEFGGVSAFTGFDFTATGVPVPEPTTALLVASGLIGLAIHGKRRRA